MIPDRIASEGSCKAWNDDGDFDLSPTREWPGVGDVVRTGDSMDDVDFFLVRFSDKNDDLDDCFDTLRCGCGESASWKVYELGGERVEVAAIQRVRQRL